VQHDGSDHSASEVDVNPFVTSMRLTQHGMPSFHAVGDRDLCLLNTMVFESPDSSGSSCQGGIYNAEEGACIPLPPYAIRSGPRRNIYFRPDQASAMRDEVPS
jgi:hypothetical protein